MTRLHLLFTLTRCCLLHGLTYRYHWFRCEKCDPIERRERKHREFPLLTEPGMSISEEEELARVPTPRCDPDQGNLP